MDGDAMKRAGASSRAMKVRSARVSPRPILNFDSCS